MTVVSNKFIEITNVAWLSSDLILNCLVNSNKDRNLYLFLTMPANKKHARVTI